MLQTGLATFCSKGYNPVGVEELCKTTGMTKGAFYNAFESKERFLLESIAAYRQMTVQHISKALDNRDGRRDVDRLRDFYTGMFHQQGEINYMGCLVNNLMAEMGGASGLVASATTGAFEHFLDVIEPVVKQAQAAGDLNPAVNSRGLTELLHSTFYGSLTRAKSLRNVNHGILTMNLLFEALKN